MDKDWLVVLANMYAYEGEKWVNKEKKMRFMKWRDHVFRWEPNAEIWVLHEGVC